MRSPRSAPRLALPALALMAAGSAAPARQPAPQTAAPTQCAGDETVLYSCRFGKSVGSVCASRGAVHYRFGPPGRPAIDIASDSGWSNVRLGRVTGGGGGHETHLRFTRNGHDYVVYAGAAGSLAETPGRQWSGIHVAQGKRRLAQFACPGHAVRAADWEDELYRRAPAAVRETLADEDPRFDLWF